MVGKRKKKEGKQISSRSVGKSFTVQSWLMGLLVVLIGNEAFMAAVPERITEEMITKTYLRQAA